MDLLFRVLYNVFNFTEPHTIITWAVVFITNLLIYDSEIWAYYRSCWPKRAAFDWLLMNLLISMAVWLIVL